MLSTTTTKEREKKTSYKCLERNHAYTPHLWAENK